MAPGMGLGAANWLSGGLLAKGAAWRRRERGSGIGGWHRGGVWAGTGALGRVAAALRSFQAVGSTGYSIWNVTHAIATGNRVGRTLSAATDSRRDMTR